MWCLFLPKMIYIITIRGWCMILYHMLRVVKIMITNINCIDRRKIFWQSKGFLRLSQLPRKTSWSGEIWCDYYNYSTMTIMILIACKSWQLKVTLANDTILKMDTFLYLYLHYDNSVIVYWIWNIIKKLFIIMITHT